MPYVLQSTGTGFFGHYIAEHFVMAVDDVYTVAVANNGEHNPGVTRVRMWMTRAGVDTLVLDAEQMVGPYLTNGSIAFRLRTLSHQWNFDITDLEVKNNLNPTGNFWQEHFLSGTPGTQPSGWFDETNSSAYNAHIAYSYTDSLAAVTRTSETGGTAGEVHSLTMTANVISYPWIEVEVNTASASTSWTIGVKENGNGSTYYQLQPVTNATGKFTYNYPAISKWSGIKNFSVVLSVFGTSGKSVVFDSVRIMSDNNTSTTTPTLTVTPTPTHSPTLTNTPTHSPTPTPTATMTTTKTNTVTKTRTPTKTITRTLTPSPTITKTKTPVPRW
jgi:hypothetical protein